MSLFEYASHPWRELRATHGPVTVANQHPARSWYGRFNRALAVWTTNRVGTMTCAYLFAALALSSLPSTLALHSIIADVQWIAQTFFQLVLLSVILVGQNVQASAADKRSEAMYKDTELLLYGQQQIAEHLAAQDVVLKRLDPRPTDMEASG